MIFFYPKRLEDFVFTESLGDCFFPRGWVIFCLSQEVGDFLVPLGDIFVTRGLVIFFDPRGCGIILSLEVGCFFCVERLGDFFWSLEVFFLS